jgi:SAM-dependent methyltransferase
MSPPPTLLTPGQRKSTGAYYTPQLLIDLLLDHALPLLTTDNGQRTTDIKVLDPACGPGDFLLTAAQRLTRAHINPHLYGIDINAQALAQARATLSAFRPHPSDLVNTDALLSPPDFLQPQSFDLILGNPPFVNAIEKYLPPETKQKLRQRHPNITGAADLACYFLDQATHLLRPGGQIAFVLPRNLLNAPATARLRATLPPHLKPNLIYAPNRHDLFPGAAVFITLLILGPRDQCQVSTDPNPTAAQFTTGEINTDNWWQSLQEILSSPAGDRLPLPLAAVNKPRAIAPTPAGEGRGEGKNFDVRPSMLDVRCSTPPSALCLHPSAFPLKDLFDLHASMTAAQAYDLLPHLRDSPTTPGQRLLTTGLINPNTHLWGQTPCRYLKNDFQHPIIPDDAPLPQSLARRIQKSKRPKILLAGLAKKLEPFLDTQGQYTGAVSTFSIYHPTDDLHALRALHQHLLRPTTTQHLIQHLGANALRGDHITLKKAFLQNLPLPPSCAPA